jgi:hypothetical protein
MGHKSTAMTERYAHATDEGKRRAVEAVVSAQRPTVLEINCHKFATIAGDDVESKAVND